jgi:hypothetical protein
MISSLYDNDLHFLQTSWSWSCQENIMLWCNEWGSSSWRRIPYRSTGLVKSLKSEINTWICSFRSKRRHWQSNYICVLGKWKCGSKTEEQGVCVCVCALHHLASFPNYLPRSSWMLPSLVGKLSNFTSENFRLKTQVARNCAKTLGVFATFSGRGISHRGNSIMPWSRRVPMSWGSCTKTSCGGRE